MDADNIKEEIAHNRVLIKEHKRRLRILQLRATTYGINVPPEVLIEIENIEKEIYRLEQVNNKLQSLLPKRKFLENKSTLIIFSLGLALNAAFQLTNYSDISSSQILKTILLAFAFSIFINSIYSKVNHIIEKPSSLIISGSMYGILFVLVRLFLYMISPKIFKLLK